MTRKQIETLGIVPCGKKKIWDRDPNAGPTETRYTYVGPFASLCRKYAEKFHASSWVTISAKYGFLFPQDIVPGAYNVSFNDPETNPISSEELSIQINEQGLQVYDRIVVLGGKKYHSMVTEAFREKQTIHLLTIFSIVCPQGRLKRRVQSVLLTQ